MGKVIMVVDDDGALRETLEEILTDEGREVVTAQDGYAAVDLASKQPLGVVFMDIQMPGINGVETFLKVKEIQPDCIVVMMTGFAVEDLIKQALSEGAYTVLHKPLAVENVLDIVDKFAPVGIAS